MIGYDGYRLRSGLARKYRIGLNIVRTGEIGVKGLFLEYGEYSAEYSPTNIHIYYILELLKLVDLVKQIKRLQVASVSGGCDYYYFCLS